MKSNIFIPKIINVGFQNRKSTYTGKLAYVIYYDEKGTLRKEKSWSNWRDKDIPNEEFDNVPIEGFVLNKKVGGYSNGWDHRQTYCRVYDPRNFEFEITVENLLYILENTNSIKGKGLEGKFVYAWNGKDLILMPISSPDYNEILAYNDLVHNGKQIKGEDLIVGATYLTKSNEEIVYMGRFDYFDSGYKYNDSNGKIKYYNSYYPALPKVAIKSESCFFGKQYWFAQKSCDEWLFLHLKSIPKGKLIKCLAESCTPDYADIFNKMEDSYHYSPYDETKDKYIDFTFENFKNKGIRSREVYCRCFKFISSYSGHKQSYLAEPLYHVDNDKFILKKYEYSESNKHTWGYKVGYEKVYEDNLMTLEEIYKLTKPQYIQTYLSNGRKYEKRYSL